MNWAVGGRMPLDYYRFEHALDGEAIEVGSVANPQGTSIDIEPRREPEPSAKGLSVNNNEL